MPIREAADYLESCNFRRDIQGHPTPATLAGAEETALHFVRVLPHEWPLSVCHFEIHVLLIHDGRHVTDIKSETISTTQD